MKETDFIKNNQEKWSNYEKELANSQYDPKTLGDQFLEASDDLSYAQTHYQNRSIRLFLNGLGQKAFLAFKVSKLGWRKQFVKFWSTELPKALYMERKRMYWAFGVFMFFVIIGMLLTHFFPDFPEKVMGTGYVEMTKENIAKGEPMAVYQNENAVDMFFRIAINNLRVSFETFVKGLLFGLGTIFALIANGVMLGSFQYMFVNEGVLQESLLGIWMHGAIEIPSIVIAAGAGFTLISGFFFPGSYSRYQSFILGAKQAVRIYLGLIPFIILAAFIESFVTRMTFLNDFLRAFLILAMFFGFIYYFIIYPILAFRKGHFKVDDVKYEEPGRSISWEVTKPLKNSELFAKANELYVSKLKSFILIALVLAIGANLFYSYFMELSLDWDNFGNNRDEWFLIAIFQMVYFAFQFFDFGKEPLLFGLCLIMYGSVLLWTLKQSIPLIFHEELALQDKKYQMKLNGILGVIIASFIALLLIAMPGIWGWFLFIFISPYVIFPAVVSAIENTNYFGALSKGAQLVKGNYGKFLGLNLAMGFIMFLYSMLVNGPLVIYIVRMVTFLSTDFDYLLPFIEVGVRFFATFIILMILPLYFNALVIFYKNSLEINFAPYLTKELKKIGKKVRAFGLERE